MNKFSTYANRHIGEGNYKLIPRFVVCAAMLMRDGAIVTGIRHFSPEMRVTLLKIYGEGYHLEVLKQGFVDQFGSFLNREEAWKIADARGQIRRLHDVEYEPFREAGIGDEGELYSEWLW